MPIRFRCPRCTQPIEVDEPQAGKLARCPYCQSVVNVPETSTLELPEIAAARPVPPEALPPSIPTSTAETTAAASPPPTDAQSSDETGDEPPPVRSGPVPPSSPIPPPIPRAGYGIQRSWEPERRPSASDPSDLPPLGSLHVGPRPIPYKVRAARTLGNYALICSALVLGLLTLYMTQEIPAALAFVAEKHPATDHAPTQAELQEAITEWMKNRTPEPWVISILLGSLFFAIIGLAFTIASFRQNARGNWRAVIALVICAPYVFCNCFGQLMV